MSFPRGKGEPMRQLIQERMTPRTVLLLVTLEVLVKDKQRNDVEMIKHLQKN